MQPFAVSTAAIFGHCSVGFGLVFGVSVELSKTELVLALWLLGLADGYG